MKVSGDVWDVERVKTRGAFPATQVLVARLVVELGLGRGGADRGRRGSGRGCKRASWSWSLRVQNVQLQRAGTLRTLPRGCVTIRLADLSS